MKLIATTVLAATCAAASAAEPAQPAKKPNVIVLLTDDLGYGDTSCYGAQPEHVKTPNIDRLAAEGVRFIDGHSAASVCTPSRYSLLTGNYAFRGHPFGSRILPGDAPLGIKPGTFTLPGMFQSQGYATAIVGKWHLGLGEIGEKYNASEYKGKIDWNGEIKPGPLEIGFNQAFIIPATGDRVPTVFVRDHRIENLDPKDPVIVSYTGPIGDEATGRNHLEQATVLKAMPKCGHADAITNGVSRIGFMTGGKTTLWKDEEISDTLLAESIKFIQKNQDKPFFLYFATHGIHEPRIPHPRFVGKSGCGTYGDHILELDDLVGRLLAELKQMKIDDNTIIVFTSDNGGCSWLGYDYGQRTSLNGHKVNGSLRGEKGSIFEGGTRIPFIVRWPGHVSAGKVSPALLSQTDLTASFAKLLGVKIPEGGACDSMDVLDALLGKSDIGRTELLEHLYGGPACALRSGNWKLINGQLFDLAADPSEKKDLAKEQPERVKAMAERMKELIKTGQTRTVQP